MGSIGTRYPHNGPPTGAWSRRPDPGGILQIPAGGPGLGLRTGEGSMCIQVGVGFHQCVPELLMGTACSSTRKGQVPVREVVIERCTACPFICFNRHRTGGLARLLQCFAVFRQVNYALRHRKQRWHGSLWSFDGIWRRFHDCLIC